jgi:dolichol kinase
MRFSRVLWLGSRRQVRIHAWCGGISLIALLGVCRLPDTWPLLRNAGVVVSAAVLLYCCYVLAALAGLVFALPAEIRRKNSHLLAGAAVIGIFSATQSPVALTSFCTMQLAWLIYTRHASRMRLLQQLAVERRNGSRSMGDLLFPICIAVSAWIAEAPTIPWLCGISVLILSDTVAALVGTQVGLRRYRSFGGWKSLEGSLAFFVATLLIVVLFWTWSEGALPAFGSLLAYCFAVTVVEAASGLGTDNFSVPLFSVISLGELGAMLPSGWVVAAILICALWLRNRAADRPASSDSRARYI